MKKAVLALVLGFSTALVKGDEIPLKLLARADAMYWFALAEGGDMKMLESAVAALDQADKGLALMPPDGRRDQLVAGSAALRVELIEQQGMAHDTLNGTLPLFRYFIFRDAVSEWVDDPLVMTAVRGARSLSAVASKHWMPYPQLDVVYASSGRETPGNLETVLTNSPTQENEMAYVFNLDGRFFNHHRGEVASLLDLASLGIYDEKGVDEATASLICRQWGIQRLLEVRIKELYVEGPWWFYVVTGRLISASGVTESTANAFGMVRDQRDKLPWLFLVLLPMVLAAAWAAVLCHGAWLQSTLAAVASFVASVAFVVAVGPWIPPGDFLLTLSWWAPAAVALSLLFLLPLLLYAVSWRFPSMAAWLFGSRARAAASGAGLGAGVGGLGTLAALTSLDPWQAALLAVLSVAAFGCIPVRLFELMRGRAVGGRIADGLLCLAALAFFVWIWWGIPPDDRSASSLMTAGLPVVLGLVSILGLFLSPVFSFAGLALFCLGAYGAMMSAEAVHLGVFALVGVVLLSLKDKSPAAIRAPRAGADVPVRHGWEEIFSNCSRNWPLARVAPLTRVEEILGEASKQSASGGATVIEIIGDAGTGKTRMIGEAIAARGWRLYQGSCRCGEPFAFLQEAAQRAGGGGFLPMGNAQEGSAAMEIGAKLVSSVPVLGALCDWISPSASRPANATPENLASEFLSVVAAAGRPGEEPPFLWVDEAEHLGEDGRALLAALVDNARALRQSLVIVLSGRRVGVDVGAVRKLSLEWNEDDRLATLQPVLLEDSARALLSSSPGLVAGAYVSWVQHLWQSGGLEERDGKLCIKGGADSSFRVPQSVVAAAGKTLEDLKPEVFEVLQAAAVDGIRFHVSAIAHASGLPLRELLRHLEHAEQWGIVEDLAEDEVFAFRNSPVREYLVSTLRHGADGAYRQRYFTLNRGLSESYAGFGNERFLPEAALHACEAGSAYLGKAISACLRAAGFCLVRGQWQQSAKFAAFSIDHGSKTEAADAGIPYLQANWLLRRNPGETEFAGRLALLRKIDGTQIDPDTRAFLACEIARTLWPSPWNTGATDPTVSELLEGLQPAAPAARIRVLHFRGACLHKFSGKDDIEARGKALAILREAAAIGAHDARSSQERAEALNTLAEVALQLGHEDEVPAALHESISIKKSTGDKQGLAISYGSLGRFHLFRRNRSSEDLHKAIDAFHEDLEISREIGDASGLVSMPSFLALCHLESGDAAKALDLYRQSASAAHALGQNRNEAFARCGIVRSLAALGSQEAQGEANALGALLAKFNNHERGLLEKAVDKAREACRCVNLKFDF